MDFFLYSKCGEGAGLALRLQEEGNKVSMFIKEREYRSVYKGMLKQSFLSSIDKDTIVIFDSSGMGKVADDLKKSGNKVFGAAEFADRLENDRKFGLNFMRMHGIEIPETKEFCDVAEALNFLSRNNGEYIFKPSGDLPSKLTYKPCDEEDLIHYLEFIDDNFDVTEFVLQECVDGTPLSTELFMGKNGFVNPSTHTIEVKKFMNCDLGPSTGCAGNTVWVEEDHVTQVLVKIEKSLIKENYIGPIDLNCMVGQDGIYGLEWTPRFGLDAMPTWLRLLKVDVGEVIYDLVNGSKKDINLHEEFASGVRVTIPPYPIEPDNIKIINREAPNYGVPIRGFEGYEEHLYFYEVYSEGGEYFHSSGTGVIAVASDIGSTIERSYDLPYRILDELKIPDKQYRTDLAEVIPEMYSEIMGAMNVRS